MNIDLDKQNRPDIPISYDFICDEIADIYFKSEMDTFFGQRTIK